MTAWATLAKERADQLEEQLQDLRVGGRLEPEGADNLVARLNQVRTDHLSPHKGLFHGLGDRLSGDQINEAWNELHRIEVDIDRHEPYRVLHDKARRHVEKEVEKAEVEKLIAELESDHTDECALRLIEDAHREAESRHESERQQQRGILQIGAGLLAGAGLVLCLQAFAFPSDTLLPEPSEPTVMSSTWLLALTMLFGMLGGALSALLSLYISDKLFTDTMWFDPRPGLTMVKISVGLWSAVIGVLAVGSGLVVGVYTSVASVLLLAVLFGYGQQALTKFMDRKVADLVGDQEKSA